MCGIVGFWGKCFPDNPNVVLDSIFHRGPDDYGEWRKNLHDSSSIWLGHRRLSIIDLSPNGHQPMIDAQSGNVIIFNGEIYNYKQLRRLLEKKGIQFSSTTDTEVLLHLFRDEGIKFVRKLCGMFAFVIWEHLEKKLWFVRDRIGVKPLYIYRDENNIAFASECRALKKLIPNKTWKIDQNGFAAYMAFGSTSEPYTLWEHITMFPPASTASWDGKIWRQSNYWNINDTVDHSIKENEAVKQTRTLLENSLTLRSIADVPIGVFLSGGVDSSIITGLIANNKDKITTLNVSFPDFGYDESGFAQMVATRYSTNHITVTLTTQELQHLVSSAVESMDQPSYDGINTWIVSHAAKKIGLTVAMSGIGGDELFYGYSEFKRISFARSPIARYLFPLMMLLFSRKDKRNRLKSIITEPEDEKAFIWLRAILSDKQLQQIGCSVAPYETTFTGALENKLSYFFLNHYLRNTLLRDADVMSMANSIELREPFLDHHLIEFVFSLPPNIKWGRQKRSKHLLINSCKDILPCDVICRKKNGFELPIDNWIRGVFKETVKDSLNKLAESALLPRWFILNQWEGFLSGKQTWSRIWQLYILSQKVFN